MDYSDLSVQLNFYVDAVQVFAQGAQGSLHSFPIADLPKSCLVKLRRNDLFQTQPHWYINPVVRIGPDKVTHMG